MISPASHAVVPAPDGGYPGNNTAEGILRSFFSLTTGIDNNGLGFNALIGNTTGNVTRQTDSARFFRQA